MAYVVGLTGGVASGKTTVANHFQQLGASIIDADKIARQLVEPQQKAYQQILEHFGPTILVNNQNLNRTLLREIIFSDRQQRKWLEALLHPLVNEEILKQIQSITSPYCIVVIPLLLENYEIYESWIDYLLVIDTPESNQIEWLMKRDQCSIEMAKQMIQSQISREQRLAAADGVITNEGSPEDLEDKIINFHKLFLER